MSWRIAADLREMFVEVAATDGHKTILGRTLNRKDQLLSGFIEALNLLPQEIKSPEALGAAQVILRTDFDRVTLRERWSSHTAFVCTEGFENLLELGTQQRMSLFGLQATKSKPLIPREMAFGVTERTKADGTVEVELDEKEIEFVLSKLALAEVKTVAVCFLHSNVNAEHEKQLAEKLASRGYEVVCSHLFKGHERERAEKACAEAFLTQGRKDLVADLVKLGFKTENIQVSWNGPFFESQPLTDGAAICEFLEDRIIFMGTTLAHISPLSQIQLDDAGQIHFTPAPIETEPGPISFGKGIQLCLLDLLMISSKASPQNLPRLKFDVNRAAKQLGPLAKQLRIDVETCLSKFIELAGVIIADEILTIYTGSNAANTSRPLVVQGWLAGILGPVVSRHRGNIPAKYLPLAPWQRPLYLLKEHGTHVEIAFGDFKFEVLA